MCGIAGFFDPNRTHSPEALRQIVMAMADAMPHRGPDDAGGWVDPSGFCALAQRRLSIIDLSPAGHQPMICPRTGNALTFNGEIYNYAALRSELVAKGEGFQSSSDTEVLLRGLSAEGPAFIDRADGMFAFAFWDQEARTLTLARDLFGEKPLYYAFIGGGLAFASELHALRRVPGFRQDIDEHRIATYLALGYVPAPLSIYTTAQKLQPGHTLAMALDGEVKIESYADFTPAGPQESGRSLDDLADELEEILEESVRLRLLTADVPVGAFLSSGVDSSLVVALAMKRGGEGLKTFSIGFEEGFETEHHDARAMAGHLGTNHHDEVLPADFFNKRCEIARAMDEPNGDSSCLPTWAVSRVARRHATVALSGDGGDELFGGYHRYVNTLAEAQAHAGDERWDVGTAYHDKINIFRDQTLETFIGPLPKETKALLEGLRDPLRDPKQPLLHRMRAHDVRCYMPDDVLAKVDRMSMQHSLEVRAPFLGRRVAAFAARQAAGDLATPLENKRILKKVAQRYIPRHWLDRPKKGFSIPLAEAWGGQALAQDLAQMLLAPDCRLRTWIAPERLARFVAFHQKTPNAQHMWPVYILEAWLRAGG